MLHCTQDDIYAFLGFDKSSDDPMKKLIAQCFSLDPKDRPSMKKVVKAMEKIAT